FVVAHFELAALLGKRLPREDLAALRQLLEEKGLTAAQRLLLHFAIAHVLDALGEYAEAAAHLEQGNALQLAEWSKRGQEFDPKKHESLVNRMIEVCTPAFFERVGRFGLAECTADAELPVFIVGLPRAHMGPM